MKHFTKLYNIYYIKVYREEYEATTDNFKKWLEEHNKKRIADGNEPEKENCFKVEEVYPILFNKEHNNEGK